MRSASNLMIVPRSWNPYLLHTTLAVASFPVDSRLIFCYQNIHTTGFSSHLEDISFCLFPRRTVSCCGTYANFLNFAKKVIDSDHLSSPTQTIVFFLFFSFLNVFISCMVYMLFLFFCTSYAEKHAMMLRQDKRRQYFPS